MIPTRKVLVLLLGPAAISLMLIAYPFLRPWVFFADAIFGVILLLDLLSLPGRKQLGLEREGGHNLSVGTTNPFSPLVRNRARRRVYVEIVESFPDTMQLEGLPASGWVKGRSRRRFRFSVIPSRRGAFDVGRTYLRANSLLGFWRRQIKLTLEHPIKVFPDVKKLNTYALLARRNRIDLMGFRQTRGRGSDVEFDRLREYQPDDDYRRIDPFASARYRKLITREYQVSRNQNIFFMIDCGRPMAGESDKLSNLDHALNATLMLSYLALDLGDNVGLMAFDQTVHTFMPVGSGMRRKNAVLHALYNLHVSEQEADYEQAFLAMQKRVRQRSLVVLLTNVMDEASYSVLQPHLKVITGRHLPLVILMRDNDLFSLADSTPNSVSNFFEVGAAAELATWRGKMASHLRRMGSMVLDIVPEQTTPDLINNYLRIKADQLL